MQAWPNCTNFGDVVPPYMQYALPVAASISVICYLIAFWMYLRIPSLQRHPTTLSIYKYAFEVIYVSQYFWLPFSTNSLLWREVDGICVASGLVAPLCWLTQFSLLGGELWFLVITRDIQLTITNPFTSYKQQAQRYTAFVAIASILPAFLLMIPYTNGVPRYGLSYDPMIWITDLVIPGDDDDHTTRLNPNLQRNGDLYVNWYKIGFFYIWMGLIYLYASYVLWFARRRLKNGLESTLKARERTIQRAQAFTFGYFVFWSVVFSIQFLDFSQIFTVETSKQIRIGSSLVLASRGIPSLIIFVFANQFDLFLKRKIPDIQSGGGGEGRNTNRIAEATAAGSTDRDDGSDARLSSASDRSSITRGRSSVSSRHALGDTADVNPHLNELLRNEVLYYTAQGIKIASLEQQLENQSKRSIGSWSSAILYGKEKPFLRRSSSRLDKNSTFSFTFREFDDSVIKLTEAERSQLERSESRFGGGDNLARHAAIPAFDGTSKMYAQPVGASARRLASTDLNIQEALKEPLDPYQTRTAEQRRMSARRSRKELEALEASAIDEANDVEARESSIYNLNENRKWEPAVADTTAISIPADANGDVDVDAAPMHDFLSHTILTRIAKGAKEMLSKVQAESHDFMFRDFKPKMFKYLRELARINEEEYIYAFDKTKKEHFSEGKSGSFMYLSKDEKYVVKTVSQTEMAKLLDMLTKYKDHVKKHPHSMISRFTGAHAIVMYNQTIYFIVMKNILPKVALSERYDLKGSWVGRNGNTEGLTRSDRMKQQGAHATVDENSDVLLLDNDLQSRINLNKNVIGPICDYIRCDIDFLQSQNLMDYSILIGVKSRKFEVIDNQDKPDDPADLQTQTQSSNGTTNPLHRTMRVSSIARNPLKKDMDGGMHAGLVEGPGTYYFGIIDVLQEWNWQKKLERWFKVSVLRCDPEGVSCIESKKYAKRFWERAIVDVFENVDAAFDDENGAAEAQKRIRQYDKERAFSYDSEIGSQSLPTSPSVPRMTTMDGTVSSITSRPTDRRFSVVPVDVNTYLGGETQYLRSSAAEWLAEEKKDM